MKTSLNLDDKVFQEAKKESLKTGATLSETISHWARIGLRTLRASPKNKNAFKPVNLGGKARVNLASRRDWLDEIDT